MGSGRQTPLPPFCPHDVAPSRGRHTGRSGGVRQAPQATGPHERLLDRASTLEGENPRCSLNSDRGQRPDGLNLGDRFRSQEAELSQRRLRFATVVLGRNRHVDCGRSRGADVVGNQHHMGSDLPIMPRSKRQTSPRRGDMALQNVCDLPLERGSAGPALNDVNDDNVARGYAARVCTRNTPRGRRGSRPGPALFPDPPLPLPSNPYEFP